MKITRINSQDQNIQVSIDELRQRLSPRGNVVSQAGRQKTLEVFGEALTPEQSVQRICRDIDTQGLSALLDYCKKLDNADLTAETLRVPEYALREAHQ